MNSLSGNSFQQPQLPDFSAAPNPNLSQEARVPTAWIKANITKFDHTTSSLASVSKMIVIGSKTMQSTPSSSTTPPLSEKKAKFYDHALMSAREAAGKYREELPIKKSQIERDLRFIREAIASKENKTTLDPEINSYAKNSQKQLVKLERNAVRNLKLIDGDIEKGTFRFLRAQTASHSAVYSKVLLTPFLSGREYLDAVKLSRDVVRDDKRTLNLLKIANSTKDVKSSDSQNIGGLTKIANIFRGFKALVLLKSKPTESQDAKNPLHTQFLQRAPQEVRDQHVDEFNLDDE